MEDVRRMVAKGDRVAIATVVDTRRSAPRPLGSRLAVSSAGEMVGSVSGGCVESDVYLRAEEVLAGGPPQLLQYGISDDDAFDVGLPCGGEIEVFVQMLDPEELDRIGSADQRGERLSVTTTLNGDSAGAKAYGEGEGHSSAVRTDETTFVEHFAPPPVVMIFGAVDTGQALCRMAKQVGFTTIVSDARAKFATPERLPDADELIVGWPAMAYDAHAARRRHLRRRPDPRPALRRARPGPGAALRRALHRRAREPARAGDAARAPAERGLHRRRDRPDPRPARPRHRRGHARRDRRLDPGRDPGRPVGARGRPALAEERAHHRSGLTQDTACKIGV